MPALDSLEIVSGTKPDASLIWLHGLGADGYDFAPIVSQLQLPMPIRFIFPHAPARPVTVNGGYSMPAWYDIVSTDIAGVQDEAGIRASQRTIAELIANERARGISSERLLLAGFSQGGAMALYAGVRQDEPLAGLLALSAYLPLHEKLLRERAPANLHTPIFMAHGLFDQVIPPAAASASAAWLVKHGHDVDLREYPMAHSVCEDEVADIRAFIIQRLTLPAARVKG